MNSKYVIFAGAHIDDYAWLGQQVNANDTIICADSGLRHAHAISVTPDIIIGDFDSVDSALLSSYEGQSKIIKDNDQNTTDLMKALSQCDHSSPVHIYGAVGARADHDFSNYLILMNMERPDNIEIITKTETRRVIKNSFSFDGKTGDYIGLFPLSSIQDLSVDGLKYDPSVLGGPYEFGWNGACNEMITNTASVLFNKGCFLITHSQN